MCYKHDLCFDDGTKPTAPRYVKQYEPKFEVPSLVQQTIEQLYLLDDGFRYKPALDASHQLIRLFGE